MTLLKFSCPLRLPRAFLACSLLLTLLVSGCASTPSRPEPDFDPASWAAREASLATDWEMRGRVAVVQGDDSGNASLVWRQRGSDFEIELSAPITRQSWRLHSKGGRVRVEGLDGGVREGSDAEALLLEVTGWRIPLAAMGEWMRGSRGAGGGAGIAWDAQGRLARQEREGWTIEYREWFPGSAPLPRKVFARKGEASVRLVVEAWGAP